MALLSQLPKSVAFAVAFVKSYANATVFIVGFAVAFECYSESSEFRASEANTNPMVRRNFPLGANSYIESYGPKAPAKAITNATAKATTRRALLFSIPPAKATIFGIPPAKATIHSDNRL